MFFAMFYGAMAQADTEIEVVDCENTYCLLELFRFLYTDDVELNWENSFNILYLSKKYMIPSLRNRCCEFLEKTIKAWFPYRRKRRGRVPAEDRRCCWDAYDDMETCFIAMSPTSPSCRRRPRHAPTSPSCRRRPRRDKKC